MSANVEGNADTGRVRLIRIQLIRILQLIRSFILNVLMN